MLEPVIADVAKVLPPRAAHVLGCVINISKFVLTDHEFQSRILCDLLANVSL